jgi:hypothetical protein
MIFFHFYKLVSYSTFNSIHFIHLIFFRFNRKPVEFFNKITKPKKEHIFFFASPFFILM